MHKKYIILTGGDTGANNLGDNWILEGVKNFYKPFLEKYEIVIMMDGDISNYNDGFKYINDTKEEFEKLSIEVKDIKLLHYYGGGYLNEYWYNWKIWQYNYLIKRGLSPQSVVFTNQGVGHFDDQEKFNDLKLIAKSVKLFGVRDKNYLQDIPKSVFMFDGSIASIDLRKIMRHKSSFFKAIFGSKKKIALNIRPGSAGEYVGIDDEIFRNFLDKIFKNEKNIQKILEFTIFSMMENSWNSEANMFSEIVNQNNIKVMGRPNNWIEFLQEIGTFDLVITTSYHMALGAIYSGVPVVSLYKTKYYYEKFRGVNALIKAPFFQYVDIDDFSLHAAVKIAKNNPTMTEKKLLSDTLNELQKINLKIWKQVENLITD